MTEIQKQKAVLKIQKRNAKIQKMYSTKVKGKAKYTIRTLSEVCGLSRSTVGRIVKGLSQ